jgi:hypothetical protein
MQRGSPVVLVIPLLPHKAIIDVLRMKKKEKRRRGIWESKVV